MNEIDDILMEMSPDPMSPLTTADLLYQFKLAMGSVARAVAKSLYGLRRFNINAGRHRCCNNLYKRRGVPMYRRRAYLKALQNERRRRSCHWTLRDKSITKN